MRVNVAKSAGFCFGVKRALSMAKETAARGGDVFMLGEIVHNEDVLRDMEASGIRKLGRLSADGRGRSLLICAHGVPAGVVEKAAERGYKIVDATCPKVKQIHAIAAKMERENRRVIVIGDRAHDEVKGIAGRLTTKAIVLDSPDGIPAAALKGIGKAAVVVQSTQDQATVEKVVEKLRMLIADLEVHNTVCQPTRIKQAEMMTMPLENDVMIIIGSSASANTRRLYEISKSLNKRTYRVRSRKEIKPGWFKDAKSVGVGAGASTPDAATEEVVKYLSELNAT